jgi:hypothetical protein
MKKKLAVVMGAGASLDFGMPSVNAVDSIFNATAQKFAPLVNNPATNLYAFLRDKMNAYYAATGAQHLQKAANFEDVLYRMRVLAGVLSDPYKQVGSNAFLQLRPLPDVTWFGAQRPVDKAILLQLANLLIDDLAEDFVRRSSALQSQKVNELAELGAFLSRLSADFELGIITLNYDNVVQQAFPKLFTGFDDRGLFDPRLVATRGQWNFIYHLHGSIHFAMTHTPGHLHEITWAPTPQVNSSIQSAGRNQVDSIEGIDFSMSTIVAGYGKTHQILRQPFRTYFAAATQAAVQADSVLFLGYGFADYHLNALFSDHAVRRRPTVIVSWADVNEDPLAFRHDDWTWNLGRTVPYDANRMAAPGKSSPADIADLVANNLPEVSSNPDCPLEVWYGGMRQAFANADVIAKSLKP